MNIKVIFNTIVASLATGITYLIGGWDAALKILAIFIVVDYVTGLMKAIYKKEVASDIGWRGLLKKASIFIVVIVAYQLDVAIANETPLFRTMSCYFYIANEGISITENIAILGVPLPGFILKVLKNIKEQNDNPEVVNK